MKKLLLTTFISLSVLTAITYGADTIVPFGNSIWVHGYTYDNKNTMTFSKSAYYLSDLAKYNRGAGKGHEISELSVYGPTIEISKPKSGPHLPNSYRFTYYPSRLMSGVTNNWDTWLGQVDSGYRDVHDYARLTVDGTAKGKHVLNILDISGVVGYAGSHGTFYLNSLDKPDATNLADFVASQVCADDALTGVVFDIEPFTFSNDRGYLHGYGQKYFYTQIAKDFAGHYRDGKSDPLHCVNGAHKQGRIFGIYTMGDEVSGDIDAISDVLTQYGNGYFVYGLYDLNENQTPGVIDPPSQHAQEVAAEIAKDQKLADDHNIPFQFSIAAASSSTQFESFGDQSSGYKMIQYAQADLSAINNSSVRKDPLFKGVSIYATSEQLWAPDHSSPGKLIALKPSSIFEKSQTDVVSYLQQNL